MIEKLTAPHWNDLDLWNKINDLISSHNELEKSYTALIHDFLKLNERVKKLEEKNTDCNCDYFLHVNTAAGWYCNLHGPMSPKSNH